MRIVSLFSLTLLLLLAACATSKMADPTGTADPRFDWFEYEGNDPIYAQQAAGPDQYFNPILAGFYPDPSIVRVDEDYYLVNSSFSYFPGVPIFHSRDLINWTQIGHVLDRPSQLPLDGLRVSRGVFAPSIHHHDGTFYMISTLVDAGGNFYVTATDPAGPWSDPVWLPFDGIDPSIFFDDDGKAYIVNNGPPDYEPLYNGHRAIWMQELDPEAEEMTGPRQVVVDGGVDISEEPIWIEAPHIYKVDGTYYLIAAEGGTSDQHSEVVFRSESVWGPYEPYEANPILTQRHLDADRPSPISSTGHADFVQTPSGDWWAVFLGTRPYENEHFNTGRETFLLPVEWTDDDWPVILAGDNTVPYVNERPDLPSQPAATLPHSGNFTVRADFDEETLAPYWTVVRTPHETWYDLTSTPGWLTLEARSVPIGEQSGQPSFLGRRQQHAYASASTAMRYRPTQPGDEAGLVAFQNDNHYYALVVTLADGEPVVQLERAAGEDAEVIASAPIDVSEDEPLYLKIEAAGAAYNFYYGSQPDAWTPLLENADGTVLSTRVAGGFVGTTIGLYAHRDAG